MKVGAIALCLALAILGGCVNLDGQLRTRAAFDLQCNEGQLRVVQFDPWTRGVSGCGKKATYTYSQPTGQWIMNSTDPNGVTPANN